MLAALDVQMKILLALLIAHLFYSGFVLFKLSKRDEYSTNQKILQSLFVLLAPFIGVIAVHGMIREFDRVLKEKDHTICRGVDGMPGGMQ